MIVMTCIHCGPLEAAQVHIPGPGKKWKQRCKKCTTDTRRAYLERIRNGYKYPGRKTYKPNQAGDVWKCKVHGWRKFNELFFSKDEDGNLVCPDCKACKVLAAHRRVDKKRLYAKIDYHANRELHSMRKKEKYEQMNDTYIISLFKRQGIVDGITQQMIDDKRLSVKIKRLVRLKTQDLKYNPTVFGECEKAKTERQKLTAHAAKYREELRDSYIRQKIFTSYGLKDDGSDFFKSLIEFKRAIILLKRGIKEVKHDS